MKTKLALVLLIYGVAAYAQDHDSSPSHEAEYDWVEADVAAYDQEVITDDGATYVEEDEQEPSAAEQCELYGYYYDSDDNAHTCEAAN